jgi:hypothetical protein
MAWDVRKQDFYQRIAELPTPWVEIETIGSFVVNLSKTSVSPKKRTMECI